MMECTGDDANEEDDGPAAANALTAGVAFQGGICNGTTDTESDWFTITTTSPQTVTITVTTDANVDVDVFLVDANQMLVDSAETDNATETIVAGLATPGTYYVVILLTTYVGRRRWQRCCALHDHLHVGGRRVHHGQRLHRGREPHHL
ncbi:MAG: PPC domain-containing protein [bacterium]